ncbi:MAG: hypothetical protein AB4080_21435 [Trichodesmium sp.]
MKIDWNFPEPRSGIKGGIDKFFGPGATPVEITLQLVIPIFAGSVAAYYGYLGKFGWSLTQYLVCFVIGFDILGGIITNSTSSGKRWYHRAGQGFTEHMSFILLHFVQITTIAWLYMDFDLLWAFTVGGYLVVACTVILIMPLYIQRPVAVTLYSLAIVLSIYLLETPVGLEWFLPLFYLKLLVSHILREEPYRPDDEIKRDNA